LKSGKRKRAGRGKRIKHERRKGDITDIGVFRDTAKSEVVVTLPASATTELLDGRRCAALFRSRELDPGDQKFPLDAGEIGDRCVVYAYNGFGQLTSVRR
jgi:hypothetical protein